jgi:hypothetical protein
MIVADVLTWFLIIAGVYLVLTCYWLSSFALFPRAVEACAERYARPARATLAGLLVLVPVLVAGLGAANAVKARGPSGALKIALLLLLLPAFLGSAGLALRIGSGLPSARDAAEPWRRLLRGGLVLAPTFLLPFLGWFVLLPWTLVSGFGAALLAWRGAGRVAPPAPPPEAPSDEPASSHP